MAVYCLAAINAFAGLAVAFVALMVLNQCDVYTPRSLAFAWVGALVAGAGQGLAPLWGYVNPSPLEVAANLAVALILFRHRHMLVAAARDMHPWHTSRRHA